MVLGHDAAVLHLLGSTWLLAAWAAIELLHLRSMVVQTLAASTSLTG